jgi:spore maturation protein CgeB
VDKARYYIENDTERSRIAEQGHQYVMEKYGEDKLWKHLLGLANSTSESKEG